MNRGSDDGTAEIIRIAGKSKGRRSFLSTVGYATMFAGVGAHSGLPYKCAYDMSSAFAAMAGARQTRDPNSSTTPTIVFHGTADTTVVPANGQQIADAVRSDGTTVVDEGSLNGRCYARETVLSPEGYAKLEHWTVEGLGHAWSGGQAGGSYTDPAGPDASAEMVRFFLNVAPQGATT